jgi:hypothetical protein
MEDKLIWKAEKNWCRLRVYIVYVLTSLLIFFILSDPILVRYFVSERSFHGKNTNLAHLSRLFSDTCSFIG